ncbi:MAG: fibronectin type III domain-containing protein [bacterium]
MRIKIIIIITIILAVVAVAIVLGFSFIQSLENRTKANVNESPVSLEITNLTDSSATIIWKTTDNTSGKVNLYGADGKSTMVLDERDTSANADTNKRKIHLVTIKNLIAATKYTFTITDNATEYFNNTQRWNFTTLQTPSSPLVPKPIFGQANVDSGGTAGILIKLVAKTKTGVESLVLSSLSTDNGTYSFDLSSLRTKNGELLNLDSSDQLIVNMSNESNKQAQITANIK